MSELKEVLEDLLYIRIGALASLSDSVMDKFDEYLERGRHTYKNGGEPNEELKHNSSAKEKDKKDILQMLDGMSDEEKERLKASLLAQK